MQSLRFGLFYDFRNPPQWRQDQTALYESILAQIVRAEALGWDDVWLSEHHFVEDGYTPSCLPLAAAIAARTSRIRIGTAIMIFPFHDPVRLAEDAATVDVLSGGRLDLGLGAGYRVCEFESFGIPKESRVGRLVEGLKILRTLFAGETLNFHGRYYRYENVTLYPRPVQQPLKVLMGGFVDASVRRAARHADGLVLGGYVMTPVQVYREELVKLGKNPAEYEVVSGGMWLIVTRDPERRWREARDHFRYHLDLYARWSATQEDWNQYTQQLRTDEQLRGESVQVVSPEEAVTIIRRYVDATHIDRWYSWTIPPGLPPEWADEHIELMAREVIPAFR